LQTELAFRTFNLSRAHSKKEQKPKKNETNSLIKFRKPPFCQDPCYRVLDPTDAQLANYLFIFSYYLITAYQLPRHSSVRELEHVVP
jgi:hypothetical protein